MFVLLLVRLIRNGALCLPLLLSLGCFHSGPYHEVIDAFPVADQGPGGYRLMLGESMSSYSFGVLPSRSSIDYYPTTLREDPHGGRLAAASDHALASEGGGVESVFVPVGDTPQWVRVRTDWGCDETKVQWIDAATRRARTVTSFRSADADPKTSAFALSPSGRHLLVVGPDGIALWDLAGRVMTRPDDLDVLSPVRKFLAERRGSVGTWWITDDLRFVVVAPSEDIHYGGGGLGRTSEAMEVSVGGVKFDTQHQGFIYDRASRKVTPFYTVVYVSNTRLPITGVVPGDPAGEQQLLLLYADTDHYAKRKSLLVSRADQTTEAFCELPTEESDAWVSSYDNRSGEVILVGRSGSGPPYIDLSAKHPRDYYLYLWNWRSGTSRRIDLSAAEVKRAIEGK